MCDKCNRTIPYLERYLVDQDAKANISHLCVDCALKMGYAKQEEEQGKKMLTFFAGEPGKAIE
jgi:hypothetical protein